MSEIQLAAPEVPAPDQIAFLAGPKCGHCAHWRQQPRPRAFVNENSEAWKALSAQQQKEVRERVRLQNAGAGIGQDRLGECRRELLTLAQLAQDEQGKVHVQSVSHYPKDIPATFPACGQFKAAERGFAPVTGNGPPNPEPPTPFIEVP